MEGAVWAVSRLEGCSSRIDDPKLRGAGARPAWAARWPAVGKVPPSPAPMRMRVPVLTPTPGFEARTLDRGWACRCSSIRPAWGWRWLRKVVRDPARVGTLSAAASGPGTVAICSSRAVKMS